MLGEVGERERTADGTGAGHDAAAELTAIELLSAAIGHGRQRDGKIALNEASIAEAIRMVDRPERGANLRRRRGGEEGKSAGGDAALAARHGGAVTRGAHGRLQEALPRYR